MAKQPGIVLRSLTGLIFVLQACTTQLPSAPEPATVETNVAVGRAVAVLTGERSRIYTPTVRSFEIQNVKTRERFRVEVESDNERFVLPIAPGDYELTRVQISEGPFLSMAQLNSTFSVGYDPITYLGTWRFGVDSPKYGRMLSVSMASDEEDLTQTTEFLQRRYPSLDDGNVATVIPAPSEEQTRLFEVMPYPSYPRYFRRHWW